MFRGRIELSLSGTVDDLNLDTAVVPHGQFSAALSQGDLIIALNPASGAALTGIAGGKQGATVLLRNVQPIGGNSLTINNLSGLSQAPNQFSLTATTVTLAPQGTLLAVYDANVWVVG